MVVGRDGKNKMSGDKGTGVGDVERHKLAMGCNGNIGSNPSSLCFINGFFKEFVSSVTGDGLRGASPFLVDWRVVRGNVVDATEGEKSSQRIMRWCRCWGYALLPSQLRRVRRADKVVERRFAEERGPLTRDGEVSRGRE